MTRPALSYLIVKNLIHGAEVLSAKLPDWRYGVETSSLPCGSRPCSDLPNADMTESYQATSWREAAGLIRWLDINYPDFTFIDLGSGKGRVMFAAAGFGFRRIIGVEFSRELNSICLRNISRFRGARGSLSSVLCDATEYQFPDDNLVVFMFNPFSYPLVLKVAENLRRHHGCYGKRVIVIYHNAKYGDILQREAFLTQVPFPAPLLHVGLRPRWPTAVFDSSPEKG